MLIVKHTLETTASPETIFGIWQDVKNWNTWDCGIEYSAIEGPFEAGTKGSLKPKGGPLVHTKIALVEVNRAFVDESKLPLAKIIVSHYIAEAHGRTQVTHQVEMTGPLAFFFAVVIGRGMKKGLPKAMEAMIKKAESA